MESQGVGDHEALTRQLCPAGLVGLTLSIAPFNGIPMPAQGLKPLLPGPPDHCIPSPTMGGDHLIHGQGRALSSCPTVSSGRSRRSTSRSRAVPSGTVGGRIATLSNPCSSRTA